MLINTAFAEVLIFTSLVESGLPVIGEVTGTVLAGTKLAKFGCSIAKIAKMTAHVGNIAKSTYVIGKVVRNNVERYIINGEEFSLSQLGIDMLTIGMELFAMKNAVKGLELDKIELPTKVKGCVDLETLGLVSSKNQIPKSSRVESIIDVMKHGEMSADGKNIITQIDSNTKILFRLDAGDNAHSIEKYGYSNPVDHINIEIQTTSASGRSYTKWDYHIILDENGNAINTFETGPWSK